MLVSTEAIWMTGHINFQYISPKDMLKGVKVNPGGCLPC